MTTNPTKPRKRRSAKPGEFSFTAALASAEKLLQKKNDERAAAVQDVNLLNIEIAGLEATIRALKNQLSPAAAVPPTLNHTLLPALVAREVPEGAGSIPANQTDAPAQERAPELPDDGDFA